MRRPYRAAEVRGALTDQALGGRLGLLVEHEVQRREGAKGGQGCQVTLESDGWTGPTNGAVTERGRRGHSNLCKGMPSRKKKNSLGPMPFCSSSVEGSGA